MFTSRNGAMAQLHPPERLGPHCDTFTSRNARPIRLLPAHRTAGDSVAPGRHEGIAAHGANLVPGLGAAIPGETVVVAISTYLGTEDVAAAPLAAAPLVVDQALTGFARAREVISEVAFFAVHADRRDGPAPPRECPAQRHTDSPDRFVWPEVAATTATNLRRPPCRPASPSALALMIRHASAEPRQEVVGRFL